VLERAFAIAARLLHESPGLDAPEHALLRELLARLEAEPVAA
jgi:hypothetical protein